MESASAAAGGVGVVDDDGGSGDGQAKRSRTRSLFRRRSKPKSQLKGAAPSRPGEGAEAGVGVGAEDAGPLGPPTVEHLALTPGGSRTLGRPSLMAIWEEPPSLSELLMDMEAASGHVSVRYHLQYARKSRMSRWKTASEDITETHFALAAPQASSA